jgi:hypothetical protein
MGVGGETHSRPGFFIDPFALPAGVSFEADPIEDLGVQYCKTAFSGAIKRGTVLLSRWKVVLITKYTGKPEGSIFTIGFGISFQDLLQQVPDFELFLYSSIEDSVGRLESGLRAVQAGIERDSIMCD